MSDKEVFAEKEDDGDANPVRSPMAGTRSRSKQVICWLPELANEKPIKNRQEDSSSSKDKEPEDE